MSEFRDNPRFSIIIPVYNGSDYLGEAIDSALAQTYQSYEVIVVNDGSNDNGATKKIALSYGKKIRYFSKSNGGTASALNYAIKQMNGEYFVWLSHDDLFDKERLRKDAELIDSNDNIFVTFCNTKTIDENKEITGIKIFDVEEIRNPYECMRMGSINMCSMTINKHCFEKAGLFNEENKTMQDVEMNVRLSKNFVFYYNPNTFTIKRIHDGMGTKKLIDQHKTDQKNLFNYLAESYSLIDFFPQLDISNKNEIYNSNLRLAHFYGKWGSYETAAYYFKQAYKIKNKLLSFPFLFQIINPKYYYGRAPLTLADKILKKTVNLVFNYKALD